MKWRAHDKHARQRRVVNVAGTFSEAVHAASKELGCKPAAVILRRAPGRYEWRGGATEGGAPRGLSLRQPWLYPILDIPEPHAKRHENRTWAAAYRGPILLHASSGITKREYYEVLEFVQRVAPEHVRAFPQFDALELGGFVATARIVDCVTESDSPWFFGPYAFVLADVRRIPFLPYKGAQGLFTLPPDVVAQCQLGAA